MKAKEVVNTASNLWCTSPHPPAACKQSQWQSVVKSFGGQKNVAESYIEIEAQSLSAGSLI